MCSLAVNGDQPEHAKRVAQLATLLGFGQFATALALVLWPCTVWDVRRGRSHVNTASLICLSSPNSSLVRVGRLQSIANGAARGEVDPVGPLSLAQAQPVIVTRCSMRRRKLSTT